MARLPSSRSLEAFVAVTRLGSLAAAGGELGLSVPALSRRIAGLEEELGVRLLERRARGVAPTAAGEAYLSKVKPALDLLRTAQSAVSQRRSDIVRLTTIPAFATRWLLPRLHRFAAQHPHIQVDLVTSTSPEGLDEQDLDLAVRLLRDDAAAGTLLSPIHVFPVWSPLWEPAPVKPGDLIGATLLGPDHRPEFWAEWLGAVSATSAAFKIRNVDPLLLYELALSGSGVAIGLDVLTRDLLAQGRLTTLKAWPVRSTRSFYLLSRSGPTTSAARALSQWLRREMDLSAS